jgi:hypothetical protein
MKETNGVPRMENIPAPPKPPKCRVLKEGKTPLPPPKKVDTGLIQHRGLYCESGISLIIAKAIVLFIAWLISLIGLAYLAYTTNKAVHGLALGMYFFISFYLAQIYRDENRDKQTK